MITSLVRPGRSGEWPVRYADLPEAEYAAALAAHGVPALIADMVAETDRAVAQDALYTGSGDLTALIGRPAATLDAAVAAGLHVLSGS